MESRTVLFRLGKEKAIDDGPRTVTLREAEVPDNEEAGQALSESYESLGRKVKSALARKEEPAEA